MDLSSFKNNKMGLFLNAGLFLMPVLSIYWHGGVMLVLLVSFFVWLFQCRSHSLQMSKAIKWLFLAGVGVFGFAVLSLLVNGRNHIGDMELERFMRFLFIFPFAYTLILYRERWHTEVFFKGLVFCGLVLFVLAPFEVYWLSRSQPDGGEIHRANAFNGTTAIILGDYAALYLFFNAIGSTLFWAKKQYVWVALTILAGIGCLLAVMLSSTRTAILALPLLFPFFVFYFALRYSKKITIIACLVVVALMAVGIGSNIAGSQDRLVSVYDNLMVKQDASSSSGSRLVMWSSAWQGFMDSPVIGQGTGSFQGYLKQNLKAEVSPQDYTSLIKFNQAHNEYLNTAFSRGLLGLFTLLGLLLIPVYVALKSVRRNLGASVMLMMTVSAFAIFNMTESMFNRANPVEAYTFLCVLLMVCLQHAKPISQSCLSE